MKFTALTLVVLLVLCSCAMQPEPITTIPPTEPAPATEPVGIYDAASRIEDETGGAVKAYPLNLSAATGIASMGSDLLLFSGEEITTLTKFSGENLCVSATTVLDCGISPLDAAVQVSEAGITYYDTCQNCLVFLDAQLKEVERIAMPETICGTPALSEDCRKLYYCTSDALRCINLETELDRFIMQMQFPYQILTGLQCNDTVIACDVRDDSFQTRHLYVSAETGEILYETENDLLLHTAGASYFAQHRDGIYTELLIGGSEQGPTLLTPHTYGSVVLPLLEIDGAVVVTADTSASTTTLDYYDLLSGKRTSSLVLDELDSIRDCHVRSNAPYIWFLRYDLQYGCDVLYCWDLSKTTVVDNRNCLSTRYTPDNPDLNGLFSCRETADELSEKYGVQILLWTDATLFQPWDYTLIPEYQVPVIREKLKELDSFLSMYPKGFLQKAAEMTSSGRIQICLVRSILGKNEAAGALPEAVGLQYWDQNKNTYLCLSVCQEHLSQSACHEISHIIDSRVLTFCKAYDDWSKLNPTGFQYLQTNAPDPAQNYSRWTEGAERAFIDTYAMSYPREDRARIMEYAVMEGAEAYFESETMQNKLRQICLGIRDAFGLKKSKEIFRWEQYLHEPIIKK